MSITRCHWLRDICFGWCRVGDSCAVDRQAERAEFALRVPDRIGEHVGIHDITRYGDSLPPGRSDFGADLVHSRLRQVEAGDIGAGGGKPEGDAAADTAGGAGDERGLFVEAEAGHGHGCSLRLVVNRWLLVRLPLLRSQAFA